MPTNAKPRLRAGYTGNQQNKRYPLPDEFPEDTVCLVLRIPRHNQWYRIFWDALFSLTRWTAYQYDDNRTATAYATMIRPLVMEAKQAMPFWNQDSTLDCVTCPDPPIPPTPPRNPIFDCLEFTDNDGDGVLDTINVYESENCMVTINVYESSNGSSGSGCGCGTNGTLQSDNGSSPSNVTYDGSGVGSTYGVTKCDVVSDVIPYYLTQAKEFFVTMKSYIDSGGNFLDFWEEGSDFVDPTNVTPVIVSEMKYIFDTFGVAIDQVISMLEDTDFVYKFQQSFWRATSEDNILTGQVNSISRSILKSGNRYLPLMWGVPVSGILILPRVIMDAFSSAVDLGKINARLSVASGTAVPALCENLAANIGETYTPLPLPDDNPYTPSFQSLPLLNDSGFTGLRLAMTNASRTTGEGGFMRYNIPEFDGLIGNYMVGGGYHVKDSDYGYTANLHRYNGSQAGNGVGTDVSGLGATFEVSAENSLSQDTLDEIIAAIQAYGGFTPAFGYTWINQGMEDGNDWKYAISTNAPGTGTLTFDFAWLVYYPQ